MRYWALLAILLAAVLLETTVAGYFTIGAVAPQFLLSVVMSFGLLFGSTVGLGAGVLGGALVDLLFGRLIGMEILVLGFMGWASGQVEERVFKDSAVLPLLAGLVGTFTAQALIAVILWFFGWRVALLPTLRDQVLPGALYNAVVTAGVYMHIYGRYDYLRPDPRGRIVLGFRRQWPRS